MSMTVYGNCPTLTTWEPPVFPTASFPIQVNFQADPLKQFTPLRKILEKMYDGVDLKDSFVKKESYMSRLFSDESWDDWCDQRTCLGQLASLVQDYYECPSQALIDRMKPLLLKANREAKEFLKSCTASLTAGALGTALSNNPLPLILGVSDCWTKAVAMPVPRREQVIKLINPIPTYQTNKNVNFQFRADTFNHTQGKALTYHSYIYNGKPLPSSLHFNSTQRKFSGSVDKSYWLRVRAYDDANNTASCDFRMEYKMEPWQIALFVIGSVLAAGGFLYLVFAPLEKERESERTIPLLDNEREEI